MLNVKQYEYNDGELVASMSILPSGEDIRRAMQLDNGDPAGSRVSEVVALYVAYDPKNAVIDQWVKAEQPETMEMAYPWLAYYRGDPDAPAPPPFDQLARQAEADAVINQFLRDMFKAERQKSLQGATVTVNSKVFDADETSQTRMARVLTVASSMTLDSIIAYLQGVDTGAITTGELVEGLLQSLSAVRESQLAPWALADNSVVNVTIPEFGEALHLALNEQSAQWFPA